MAGTNVPAETRSPHVIAQAIVSNTDTFHNLIEKTRASKERIDVAAALICLVLTKTPYPKYQYGLASKLPLPTFNATDELTWVWADNQKDFAGWIKSRILSVMDFKGCHRSGWQYVVDALMKYHDTSDQNLILDNYVDRTFLWSGSLYTHVGVIPFRKPWCGFIHHTFDTGYSEHNLEVLFETPTFLESLKQCKYLFTLSKYLRAQIEKRLHKLGYSHIAAADFIHPTETCDLRFSIDKFQANNKRKLVQIGAWLRDTYAIYHLGLSDGDVSLQKAVLRGGNMDNYFKPGDFSLTARADSIDCKSILTLDITDKIIEKNRFVSGLLDYTLRDVLTVEVITRHDNGEYDKLLSENIVFLKLMDASAVNTVIECIVRNTPVLVNRHPAVVEMLGTEYPFYYRD
ncbi:hypothetical protein HDU81_009390 [Chytriomyces hyalinus]|nr:hypothetical protein HDU81_009390 [Chytriomyces hyalinus]